MERRNFDGDRLFYDATWRLLMNVANGLPLSEGEKVSWSAEGMWRFAGALFTDDVQFWHHPRLGN